MMTGNRPRAARRPIGESGGRRGLFMLPGTRRFCTGGFSIRGFSSLSATRQEQLFQLWLSDVSAKPATVTTGAGIPSRRPRGHSGRAG